MQSNRTTPSRAAGVGTTIALLLLGILLTLAALYFAVSHLRPKIEADLTARVTEALDEVGIADAKITVEGQDVTLWGKIADAQAKENAEQIAANVYGISRVSNQLFIDGEPTDADNTSQQPNQTETESALAAVGNSTPDKPKKPELVIEPSPPNANSNAENAQEALSPSTLEIMVVDGRATVQGIVPDEESIERINAALAGKFGQANVEDDMSTYVGSATPVWLDGAIALIDQMGDIKDPSLKITKNKAIFGGLVSSETLGTQKTALAKKLLGDHLEVSSTLPLIKSSSKLPAPEASSREPTKRPASLKIISDNGDIQLTGKVSSLREARTIRDTMNNIFGSQFSDDLLIDESVAVANWSTEALRVTDRVKSVDNFSVSVNSGQLLLSGYVSDRSAGRELANEAAQITGRKLNIVNNFSAVGAQPVTLSGEELLAQELKRELDSLATNLIVFNSGRTTLTDNAKQVLDQVALTILTYNGQVVEIAGHTDSSGDALVNLELSKKRAVAVRDYLIEKQVPSGQLQPIGYGETKPVADNDTPEGQAANRRIEFNL